MRYLRIGIRLLLMLTHLLIGFLLSVLFFRNGPQSWFKNHIVTWWLRTASKIAGLRIKVHGHSAPKPVYLVANHISWLDIIVIGGLQPVSFLSKKEVLRWPLIGYLAKHAGTLFIKRGAGASTAMQSLGNCLQQGMSAAIFPEGTTSLGQTVQGFYPRLFAAAIDKQMTIQPLAITYPAPTSPDTVNPVVPLKSQPNFIASVLAVIGQPHIDVIIRYTIPFKAVGDRKHLTQQIQEAVITAFETSYGRR